MKLYFDGTLIHPLADASAVKASLPALKLNPRRPLELRRDGASSIRASYEPGVGTFVDLSDPKMALGWLVPEGSEAAVLSTLLEYLEGGAPELPRPANPGLRHVVVGDKRDDCPLCRMLG